MSHPVPFHVQDGFSVAESDVLAFARQVALHVEKSSMLADSEISFHFLHFPHCRLNESFLFLFLGKMWTIWWC